MKCSFGISNFLEEISKSESESEVTQSCPTLWDPVDCSPPGSSIHRILQARILEWVAISFSMKRTLVFPILLFSSIFFTDHWGRLSYLSLLFFRTLHSNGNIFPYLLCLWLLLFSQVLVRPPQATILPFYISFSWGWSWSLSPDNVRNLSP